MDMDAASHRHTPADIGGRVEYRVDAVEVDPLRTVLKLMLIVICSELVIMVAFQEPHIRAWLSAGLRDALGALLMGIITGVLAYIWIVIPQRRALKRSMQLNRMMRLLSDCNQRVQRNTDIETLQRAACDSVIVTGEFRFAWIGMLEGNGGCKLTAWAAADQTLSDKVTGLRDASELSRCVDCECVIREGVADMCDIRAQADCAAPWRDDLIRMNMRQALIMPLKVDGNTVGVFAVYAGKEGVIDEAERIILDEVADDISQTLQSIRRAEERAQLMDKMQQRLNELERFQRATVDREFRIKELRDEIAVLKGDKA